MIMTEVRGNILQGEVPDWKPLLDLAPDHVDDFMWMFEVECDNGIRLHAYKHWKTRRYLHLDRDGRAFVYCGGSCYREIAPLELLGLALV